MAAMSGENYFDGMQKLGRTHKHFLWIAAVCYFFDQMDMQMINNITPAIMEDCGFTLTQISQLNSLNFLGMCLGGLLGGMFATRFGRKTALLFLVGVFSGASIINAMSSAFGVFQICRFLVGFGTIGMVTVAMVYMAEMLPSATRGKYQALSIACGTIGVPFGAAYCAFMLNFGVHTWRACFLIGGASILLIPIGMKWLRESPRWLVMRGKIQAAEKIVAECTGVACDLSELATRCTQEKTVGMGRTVKIMLSKSFLRQTLVVMLLCWGATMGSFYMGSYGNTFMMDLGLGYQLAVMLSATAVVGTPFGDVAVSFLSDKGGRRVPIFIFASIAAFLCFFRGVFTQSLVNMMNSGVVLGYVIQIATSIIYSACAGGMMTMVWTYLAESFPTSIRSNATGLIFASGRAIAVPITLTVPATYALTGYLGVNIVNGLLVFVPGLLAFLFGISSAGKSLEQLEEEAQQMAC